MKALRSVGIAAAMVATVTAGFAYFFEPRQSVLAFGALFFASAAVMGTVVWRCRRPLWAMHWKRALIMVVVVAALFRIAALVAPISLSDDIWRYLWDGQIVLEGESPYAESATERLERGLGDRDLYEKLNRPDAQTVYPPLAQMAFAAAVGLEQAIGGASERWLRAVFSLFDLLGIVALGLVLVRYRRSVMWVALYAWHPLAYWEVAAGGHTEALGIVWLAALLGFAASSRPVATGVAIGLAGLAKWTFLVVSPVVAFFLMRRRGLPAAVLATVAALVVSAVGYAPFYTDRLWDNHLESLGLYAGHFSFNAPVYYTLRFLLGYREGITEPVSHITGPLLTAATIGAVAVICWWQDGTRRRLFSGVAWSAAAYIAFTPVFHPWYALPLLAAGALAGWTTPAVLGVVIVVSYTFYAPWMSATGQAVLMGVQTALVGIWAVWEFGSHGLRRILERRGVKKARIVAEFLDGQESVLDLGAGEGFVGQTLADQGHPVQLVDVVDRNATDLDFKVYDGVELPFDTDAFDVVVISYVLHHAERPDKVLSEALRVGRKVVILETVYERGWDRRLVTVLDHSANALRGMAPEPLRLDTVDGWLDRIDSVGGHVESWRWLGRGIHRHIAVVCRSR